MWQSIRRGIAIGLFGQQAPKGQTPLSKLLSDHVQKTSKLCVEMIRLAEAFDEQMTKLREKSAAAEFTKPREIQSFSEAFLSQERYASDTKLLLVALESQKQEMETRLLSTLLLEHVQKTSELRVEMTRRGEAYDEQITKLRMEMAAELRKQTELLSLNQVRSPDECSKLQSTQEELKRDYDAKLAAAEQVQLRVQCVTRAAAGGAESIPASATSAFSARVADSATVSSGRATKSETKIPNMAIGPEEWKEYFGVDRKSVV